MSTHLINKTRLYARKCILLVYIISDKTIIFTYSKINIDFLHKIGITICIQKPLSFLPLPG